MIALFILLNLADAVTTYLALRRPGFREVNGLMRWLMDRIGLVPALGAKMAVAAFSAYCLSYGPWWLLAGFCAAYAGVVAHNIKTIA